MNPQIKKLLLPLLILLITLTTYSLFFGSLKQTELWVNLEQLPDRHAITGSSPLNFYQHKRYRQNYMYPQTFYSSYPYPHQEPLDYM